MYEFDTITRMFEGKSLTTLSLEGRPAWVASRIGAALGYGEHGDRLVHKILGEWNAKFAEGTDYVFLSGDPLAALRSIATEGSTSQRTSRASVLLLLESGLQLVLGKTPGSEGVALRRFLDEEILPQLGRFRVDGSVPPDPKTTSPGPRAALEERRERRLALEANTAALRVSLYDRQLRSAALYRVLDALGMVLSDPARIAVEVTAAEIATGLNIESLLGDPSDNDPSAGAVLELDRAA